MEKLGALFGAIGTSTFLYGLIMFLPFEKFKKYRKWAKYALILGFSLFVAGVIITPKPPKDTAKNTPTENASVEKPSDKKNPQIGQDAQAFAHTLMAAMGPCDQAGKGTQKVAQQIQRGDISMYEGYSAAVEQVEGCKKSDDAIGDIEIPSSFDNDIQSLAEKAKDDCRSSVRSKIYAAQIMAEIFDGDTKPSKMHQFKEAAETIQGGTIACAASVFVMASKAGVDAKDLKF